MCNAVKCPRGSCILFLAALIALALTTPAEAKRKTRARLQPSTFCQPYAEPGVNPNAATCAQRVQ